MGLGKMTTFIDIIEPRKVKDESGFITVQDVILASVRAYKEIKTLNNLSSDTIYAGNTLKIPQ